MTEDEINKVETLIGEIEYLYKIAISNNRPPEYYKSLIQEAKDWIEGNKNLLKLPNPNDKIFSPNPTTKKG